MTQIIIAVATKVSEYLVAPIGRQLSYLFCYRGHMDDLNKKVQELGLAKDDLQMTVIEAMRRGDEIRPIVQDWLTRADGITGQAEELMNDENKSCLNGWCPNLRSRYLLSREADKKAQVIAEIVEHYNFLDGVSYRVPPRNVTFKEYKSFESRASTLNKIMDALRDDKMKMIGVWGMGGVGKTTLVKQVSQLAEDEKLFTTLVYIDVSWTRDSEKLQEGIAKIQQKIADMLDLEFKGKDESTRAVELKQRLQKEKILIILDDIWMEVNLEEAGIPSKDDHKDCKIVLVSRDEDLLRKDMCAQECFPIQHLQEEEAWHLFKKTAGDSVEGDELRPIAIEVVNECEGLPIAIVTIANALRGESVAVWENALEELRSSAPTNIGGVDHKVYGCLKLSYNHLKGDEVKSLFLLCGCLSNGDISMHQLLQYAMGLDLFYHLKSLEQARIKLVTLVRTLKASSLLLDVEDGKSQESSGLFNEFVRMHNVVRGVARAIAREDPHRFVVEEALGFEEYWEMKDEFTYCTHMLIGRDIHRLPGALVCPKLEFLLLDGNNSSLKIPDSFFVVTKELKVLSLSETCLTPLPSSLHFLPNLRTLCLDQCQLGDIAIIGELKQLQVLSFVGSNIKQLPKEMMQLSDLRWLDLRNCSYLKAIPQNVISSLSRLECMCMENSFTQWEVEGVNNGESNACLSELKHLSWLWALDIKIPNLNLLPPDMLFDNLTRYRILVGDHWMWHHTYKASRTLKLSEVKIHLVNWFSKLLKRIEDLELRGLDDTKHVANELDMEGFLELKHLQIHDSPGIQYIINSMDQWVSSRSAFPILEELHLRDLINLDAVCHGPIPVGCFGNLRILQVGRCKNLQYLLVLPTGERRELVFPQLISLSLEDLPKLSNFYSTGTTATQESLTSNEGPQGIYSESMLYAHTLFFDQKVVFPKLEFLYVTGLDNVKKIWHNQLFANSFSKLKEMKVENCNELQNILTSKNCLPSLESLTIDSCNKLKEVFDLEVINVPEDVTDSQQSQLGLDDLQNMKHMCNKVLGKILCVQNLKFLKVHNCGSLKMLFSLCTEPEGIKEIIRQGEGAEEIIDKIEFPELRSLSLESLPSLASFYPGSHTLRRLDLIDHDILTPVLFGEKVSFPNLEILKLSGLFKLTRIWDRQLPLSSFCNLHILEVEKCPFLLNVVPSYLIASLQNLKKLNVEKCDRLQEVFYLEGLDNADYEHARMLSKLEELKLIDLPKLRYIWNKDLQQISCFRNLKLLHVKQCGSLTHLFSSGMALDLERLKDLCVEHCSMIKEIIMVEDRVADKIIFPQTTQLSLLSLPNLTSFYRGTRTHEKVHMEDCDILACVLFHEKVSFPNLEILKLCELSKLTEIWDRQLPLSSFCNLHILEVKKCPLLFNVVPNNLIASLQNLEKLNVEKCDQLKEVFDLEGLDHTDYENARMLSKIEELKLIDLPQLGHICNKDLRQISFFQNLRVLQLKQCDSLMYLFSASMALGLVQLDNLWVEHCSQIKEIIKVEDGVADKIIFRQTTQLSLLSLPKLTSFYQRTQTPGMLFNEEVSFPNLKSLNLSLTWKEIELKAFFNLRILIIENCPFLSRVLSSDSVQNLSNLKKLTVKKCDLLEEVFDLNGLDNADNEHVEMLSKLEELSLIDLPSMRYICNNRPRQVSCFQNLKLVRVKQCDSLMYLFSASMALGVMQLQDLCIEHCSTMKVIVMEDSNTDFRPQLFSCFQNLKFVQVKQCDSLMHLFSASMAFGLVQLKHLCIENCSMIEVIAPAEDGVTDSIVFPEITQLSLLSLPNLTSFYLRTQNLEVLFNEKVAFPNLEFLYVSGLDNVKKIWHNKLLADSFSKLKETRVENCKELLNISSSNVMNCLPSLEFLTIASCGKLTEVFDLEVMNVQEDVRDNRLGRLVLDDLQNLEHICNKVLGKKLCLQNLRFLKVHNCGRVKRLFSPYTELEGIKEIIGQEEGAEEVTDKIEFPELTSLSLKSLPSLASFYPGGHTLKMVGPGDHDILITVLFHEKVAFPCLEDLDISNLDGVEKIWHNEFVADSFGKLKRLSVWSCNKLRNIIPSNMLKRLLSLQILKIVDSNSVEEIFDLESIDSEEHNDIPTLQLRELCLDNLETLKCVWNKAPQGLLTYQNLKSIRVSHCPSLKTPFPGYVVRSLLQVKEVDMNSHRVKEIVAHEDMAKGVSMFLFPEVTSLTNSCLKELKCFYLGLDNLEWPMLKRLEVESCESLEMLASELDKPVEQPIFLCDKVAFPNLEFLNLCLKLKEIQDLHVLFGALPNLKILIVENCPYLSSLFSPQFILCLNNLKKLTVTNCDLLEELFDLKGLDHGDVEHVERHSQIEEVSLIDLPMLRYICNNSPRQVLCFKNLKLLQVKRCQGMTYLFSPSMVLGLVQLRRLCIEHCDKMKEIVTAEEGVTDKIIFPQITLVSLLKLPNLTSFYPSQSLEKIHMGDSNSAPGVLFNEKVKFPELEILYVSGLDNVKKIWHHQLLADSFRKLKETKVENCKELLNISSSNVMNCLPSLEFLTIASCGKLTEVFDLEVMNVQEDVRDNRLGRLVLDDLPNLEHICNKVLGKKLCLQNLRFLKVHNCGRVKKLFSPYTELEGVKEIIGQEEGAEEVIDKIEFPELTSLSLKSLPSLASFYPGSHTLRMVGPGDHDILLTVLFHEMVAFPNLEYLHVSGLDNVKKIWHNQLLGDSFSKLKKMEVENCNELQNLSTSNVLNWLPSLEFLKIDSCGKLKEVFDQEVINVQEDVTDTQLSQLVLDDKVQNLNVLEVHNCGSMKNIFSPDMALGLVRLEGTNEIIEQEDGAEEVIDKIEFPELTSLSLKTLPSLESFYPGSHTRRVGLGDHGILTTVLFNEKVAFPSLKSLNISGLGRMQKIWHNKLIENSFSKLAKMEVECCDELQNCLPLFVLKSSSLQILRIANCGKLKEAFDLEGTDILDDVTETQLNELVLHYLPQLQYIWNRDPYGILTYENLELVEVHHCQVLKVQFPSPLPRDLSQLKKQLIRSHWTKDLREKDEGKDFVFPEVTYNELELPDLRKIKGKEVVVVGGSDYVGEISGDMPGSSG